MKIFETDLILTEDTTFNESINIKGNILGKDGNRYNLKVDGKIDAGNINARNIDAWNIDAGNINARNIDAGNINARNIDAWNIDAGDINTWDINAGDINALDINAGDINALDINARDINFYAVCFASNNIKCKSIKGRRENCKHFVLDGKIEIKEVGE